jgi:hypothetical protein
MKHCENPSCGRAVLDSTRFCQLCTPPEPETKKTSMAQRYPKYYKSVKGLEEIDVYIVHQLFNIEDPSGCIQHASKKLLLSGVRTGGKSKIEDIKEARDTLTRFLQLHGAA